MPVLRLSHEKFTRGNPNRRQEPSYFEAPVAMKTITQGNRANTMRRSFDYEDIIRLWTLRLMAFYVASSSGASGSSGTGRSRHRLQPASSQQRDKWATVASVADVDLPESDASDRQIKICLQRRLQRRICATEKKLQAVLWLECIAPEPRRSLIAVGAMLGLEDEELRCLAFLLFLKTNTHLRASSAVLCLDVDEHTVTQVIAAAIGLPLVSVQSALSSTGRLMGCQLIRWYPHSDLFYARFEWASRAFPREMLRPDFDPFTAMRDRVLQAPAPTLAWEQFSHLGELQRITLAYVRQALESSKRGVNVLLHGPAGVGKSEFTRVLARELGAQLLEVTAEDEDGAPVNGWQRLQALRVLHNFCSGRRCMLVFDEIEDVFPGSHPAMGAQPPVPTRKGWVNRMLETNPSITFWLTNAVEALDPAFVRRFDLVVEFKNPPAAWREAQLRDLPIALPEATITKMAACNHLTPAVLNRASAVVNSIRTELPEAQLPEVLELVVNQTLKAQGFAKLKGAQASGAIYNPTYINVDLDPVALVEGIRKAKSARLCLYGPPGTGKTAYAQWLAEQLQLPMHIKRTSDLLSPFVGQSEKNLAAAFREARQSHAVLLIDEVDSFLQDRTKAHRSWEVTQVNEFLTRLEQFQGVFIATTNLMEGLDPAALRRFDLKAKFGYLRPEQARGLLAAQLTAAEVPPAPPPALRQLDSLPILTPGDFAAVARQHRFHPLVTAESWIAALETECAAKPAVHRQVVGFAGFTPSSKTAAA